MENWFDTMSLNSFTGDDSSFHISFACLFSLLSVVFMLELSASVKADGCRPTVHKFVTMFMLFAGMARVLFHTVSHYLPEKLNEHVFGLFYLHVASAYSLIVCFWAEKYHLHANKLFINNVFVKIAFGSFQLLVWVFFFINCFFAPNVDIAWSAELYAKFVAIVNAFIAIPFCAYAIQMFFSCHDLPVMDWVRFRSTFGLTVHAVFQLCAASLLLISVFIRRLYPYEIVLGRVVELAIGVWWCCVLCYPRQDKLWVFTPSPSSSPRLPSITPLILDTDDSVLVPLDGGLALSCHMCCDESKTSPLIAPCLCRGELAFVHQECVLKWVKAQVFRGDKRPGCRVCGARYRLAFSRCRAQSFLNRFIWWFKFLGMKFWMLVIGALSVSGSTSFGLWIAVVVSSSMFTRGALAALWLLLHVFLLLVTFRKAASIVRHRRFSQVQVLDGQSYQPPEMNESVISHLST
eukprot:GILK01005655.1.p1 GENE.GILK01005655.1~~GILK01005655.1.p1  ORF type:complete len:493 (-),score=40.94 GILK01005655.1:279-1664(-)